MHAAAKSHPVWMIVEMDYSERLGRMIGRPLQQYCGKMVKITRAEESERWLIPRREFLADAGEIPLQAPKPDMASLVFSLHHGSIPRGTGIEQRRLPRQSVVEMDDF
jgi:hypothetical protein